MSALRETRDPARMTLPLIGRQHCHVGFTLRSDVVCREEPSTAEVCYRSRTAIGTATRVSANRRSVAVGELTRWAEADIRKAGLVLQALLTTTPM